MNIDIKSLHDMKISILPQAATGNVTGSAIDTAGFNSGYAFGILDDAATGSFKVTECDTSGGTYTDVADANLVTADDTNDTAGVASGAVTLGFKDVKRYVKVVFTHTGSGDIAGGVVLGNADVSPTGANS